MHMVNKLEQKTVNIGDLVQWACNGIDQFDTPRRVRATQMQDQQERAFVEGSNTGMPVSELTVVTSAPAVMEKALSDPVASPLISETCERSAASLRLSTQPEQPIALFRPEQDRNTRRGTSPPVFGLLRKSTLPVLPLGCWPSPLPPSPL